MSTISFSRRDFIVLIFLFGQSEKYGNFHNIRIAKFFAQEPIKIIFSFSLFPIFKSFGGCNDDMKSIGNAARINFDRSKLDIGILLRPFANGSFSFFNKYSFHLAASQIC